MVETKNFLELKNNLLKENEGNYGKEIREKYGDNEVNKSYDTIRNMTEVKYKEAERLSEEMMKNLKKAYKLNDPACKFAKKAVELHKEWLSIFYNNYSKEYHLGLANMYVMDERFRKNYDVVGKNATEFLKDAIVSYFDSINNN